MRLKLPRRSTTTRSHCGAMRMLNATTKPATTAAMTTAEVSTLQNSARMPPATMRNSEAANRYTLLREVLRPTGAVMPMGCVAASARFSSIRFDLLRTMAPPLPSGRVPYACPPRSKICSLTRS